MSPKFEATDKQRGQVEAMVVCGIPREQIAQAIGITRPTLDKHFKPELELGDTKVKLNVGSFIVNSILGRDGGITDEKSRTTLAIFFAKTRMHWKETLRHEGVKDGAPIIFQVSKDDSNL